MTRARPWSEVRAEARAKGILSEEGEVRDRGKLESAHVSLNLGPEALARLDELAAELEVPRAHVVRMALRLLDYMRHHSGLVTHEHVCCKGPVYGVAPRRWLRL